MTKQRLILDCAALSSGTMATLTGFKRYDDIDKVQNAFVEWVILQPVYKNWRVAWGAFIASQRGVV